MVSEFQCSRVSVFPTCAATFAEASVAKESFGGRCRVSGFKNSKYFKYSKYSKYLKHFRHFMNFRHFRHFMN